MAGESPDKTEQRKSSGTAAEERDPRFAVFREPGADDGAKAADEVTPGAAGADAAGSDVARSNTPASDRPVSVTPVSDTPTSDTATAVFRPRLPEDDEAGAGAGRAAGTAAAAGAASADGAASVKEPVRGADSAERAPAKAEKAEGEPAEGEKESAGAGEEPAGAGKERAGAVEGPEGAVTPQKPSEGPQGPEASGAAGMAPGADAEAEAAGTAERSEAEGDQAAEADAKADAEAKPTADAKAEPEAKAEADTAVDSDSDAESDTGTDSAPASDSETGSDLRGIDQPTAVFKAVTPPKKVDQPTTALKLPPQDKPADGDQAEPGQDKQGKRDEPESAVERTSTFVPLRSDDVRPAASATAPAPAETDTASTTSATPTPTPSASSATPSWAAAERTRQQPLPPKPPLDLLAELTNTPPPPETPVRTAVRRVKIWTPLVLLLLIIFAIVQVMRPLPEPALKLTAKPTYAFEGGDTKLSWPGQGQSAVMVDGVGSLGSEGAQKSAPIASVAKVMTAYVILKEHPLKGDEQGETITADQKAEDESKNADESVAPLKNGQKLSQRQMLQLLMIPSGNNAARLLARWDAGSEDAFVDKMNDAAKDLGMTDSTYTDPSGLDKATVSTATDQLKLAQAVMKNDVFRTIVDMPEVEIEGIDGKIYNNNTLLLQPGVSGIKTGSSTPAGGNLLWSANTKVDGKVLWIYGAVMGQQAGTGRVYDSLSLSLTNSLKLIKDAQQAVTSATVVKKGDVVGYVDNGFGAQTPVVATKDLKAVGWPGLEVELKVTDNGKGIGHEAKAGSEVGMVTVGTGTGKVTAPVVLQDDLTEPAFGDKLTRIG
ncbi:serine hydrolase [Streptomyces bacillaris]|uniref:serine hydrolase n=1 Tax=Streptomyces bacillaris TaxID=68179 RepID=UPI0036321E74